MSDETVLGKARCSECGGTKVLVITKCPYENQGLIYSRCLDCGFTEDEWRFGDNPEYLEHLAKTYGVSVEQIDYAVKKYSTLPTNIQRTIIQQLNTLNPFFETLYNVKAILALGDGRTIRLHTNHKGRTINIDITYHHVPDYYSIKLTEVKDGEAIPLEETEPEISFQMLDETIHNLLHKHVNTPLRYI